MQAIITTYLGPTNFRGSRIKAKCYAGSVTIGYPHQAGQGQPAHELAARALAEKLGWDFDFIGGGLPSGDFAWVSPAPYKPTAALDAKLI